MTYPGKLEAIRAYYNASCETMDTIMEWKLTWKRYERGESILPIHRHEIDKLCNPYVMQTHLKLYMRVNNPPGKAVARVLNINQAWIEEIEEEITNDTVQRVKEHVSKKLNWDIDTVPGIRNRN